MLQIEAVHCVLELTCIHSGETKQNIWSDLPETWRVGALTLTGPESEKIMAKSLKLCRLYSLREMSFMFCP